MAFHDLPKSTRGRHDKLKNTVTAAIYNAGVIVFRVSEDLHRKMGAPSFVSVLVGDGEHTGRIAIIPKHMKTDKTVRAAAPKNSSAVNILVSAGRVGVSKARRGTVTLSHDITDDGLIVDIRPLMKPVAVDIAA